MKRHYLLFSLFISLMLVGCATEPAQRPVPSNQVSQADTYMQRGQYKQAASLYQSLAKTMPERSAQFSLLAGEAFIRSGNTQSAQFQLESINPMLLLGLERNRLNLLHAQVKLSNGEAEQSLIMLETVKTNKLNSDDKISFYQSLAFSHSLMGNQIKSVQARIELNQFLDDTQRNENSSVIFDTLSLLPKNELNLNNAPAGSDFSGWIALTRILKSPDLKQSPEKFQGYLDDWKQLYVEHPAKLGFLQSYFEGLTNNLKLPSSIALILPESGRFARAAQVIKEGFMEAYNHSQAGYQPSLSFYDSSLYSSVELYNQAVSEGAELVIGPLGKDNIQALGGDIELTVPVLALNHVPDLIVDNLFQFGLSPIDEAIQISNKASSSGHEKVLLLAADSSQGARMVSYISDDWEQNEGTILEYQFYTPKENDFSKPIKALLNLDESRYRYNQVRRFLATEINFSERRRQDVDAIFLSAKPQEARSIYPQLQFYHAKDVPVFSTPQVYTGKSSPSLDMDLEKITFCDIPWLFPLAYPGELSKDALQNVWQSFPNKYFRLMALGIDSFNLISHLGILDSEYYLGATGKLLLNQENRITRQLVCAKFIKGEPVLQTPLYEEIFLDQEESYFFQ